MKEKKQTASEKIINSLASSILSGELKPGEKLLNERLLAEQMGATRSQVREALRALELVGMVEIKPSDGTFVTGNQSCIPENPINWIFKREVWHIDDLYHARKLIETDVVKSAFYKASGQEIVELENIQKQLKEFEKNLENYEEYNSFIEELDLYMGKICENIIMERLMQTMILLRRESSLKILKFPESIERSIHYRNNIIEAFIKKDRRKLVYYLNGFYTTSKQFFVAHHGELEDIT